MNPANYLAPGLPKTLRLPDGITKCRYSDLPFATEDLLTCLGLTIEQAGFVIGAVYPWAQDGLPNFEAIPRNPRLAGVSGQNLEHSNFDGPNQLPDLPDYGIFYFCARVRLSESDTRIIRDFSRWLKAQRKALEFGNWAKTVRDPVRFHRDVVVYALCITPGWSVDRIALQLRHLNLPPLDSSHRTDSKAAVRKLKHVVGYLLDRAKRSAVLEKSRND